MKIELKTICISAATTNSETFYAFLFVNLWEARVV